jgi:hypothetical protein
LPSTPTSARCIPAGGAGTAVAAHGARLLVPAVPAQRRRVPLFGAHPPASGEASPVNLATEDDVFPGRRAGRGLVRARLAVGVELRRGSGGPTPVVATTSAEAPRERKHGEPSTMWRVSPSSHRTRASFNAGLPGRPWPAGGGTPRSSSQSRPGSLSGTAGYRLRRARHWPSAGRQ